MKKTKHIAIPFAIFALLVLFSCKKDELKLYKLEISSETVYKTRTSAEITVNYNYPTNLKQVNGYVSTLSSMTVADKAAASLDGKSFVVKFQELEANTTYYYQFEYSNGVDEILTEVKSFTTNDYILPTVTTNDVTIITATTATCGGNVTDDGDLGILARGVCWSTSNNPTINDSHTVNGTGLGSFNSSLSGLSKYSKYYVRAYATNDKGTGYGEQMEFYTMFDIPDGAINALFSVSSHIHVAFSQGNLQYKASSHTWRFAENQYDYIGNANASISSSYNGWIDLFGWGTGNSPTNISTNISDFYDWGNNVISNGGNMANVWQTLTRSQWNYLLNRRNTSSGIRYALAKVNGINGIILLPDYWNAGVYSLDKTNNGNASFSSNTISLTDWSSKFEANGAVFLPAAGFRNGTTVIWSGYGFYWSSDYYDNNNAYFLYFYGGTSGMGTDGYNSRSQGQSVRLVCPAE